MSFPSPSRSPRLPTLRVLVACLCVLLILFIGAAQLLHTHTANEAANPGCSLCAVAHLSALPTPVPARPVVAETIAPVRQPEPAATPPRFVSFSIYVRPPPVLTTLS